MPEKRKRTLPQRRTKGQARKTALMLFGIPHKMESKEQRESLALVLRKSGDARMQLLARQALDPDFKHTSFATLAENNHLNYHMIADEFKGLMRSEGFIRQAQHLPEIMEQTAMDAKSKWITCETCDGVREVPDIEAFNKLKREAKAAKAEAPTIAPRKQCPRCKGEGLTWQLGDIDRLKLVYETYGLTGKGGGVGVQVNISQPPAQNESMADLAASIGPILEGNTK
jgi:hypothetical protein